MCVHRGTRLSLGKIDGDLIECPYHGWTYDTEGICVRIPAHPDQIPPTKARVKTYHARDRYGVVWVNLGAPRGDVLEFRELANEQYRSILCGPYAFQASAPRVVENFLDIAHFPFVHEGLPGLRERPKISDWEASTTGDGVAEENDQIRLPD